MVSNCLISKRKNREAVPRKVGQQNLCACLLLAATIYIVCTCKLFINVLRFLLILVFVFALGGTTIWTPKLKSPLGRKTKTDLFTMLMQSLAISGLKLPSFCQEGMLLTYVLEPVYTWAFFNNLFKPVWTFSESKAKIVVTSLIQYRTFFPCSIPSNGCSSDRCQTESNSNPRHCLQTKTFAIEVGKRP